MSFNIRYAGVLAFALFLGACGGGGGGTSESASGPAPAAAQVDLGARNVFPGPQLGDTRVYQVNRSNELVTREVTRGPDANGFYVVTETDSSAPADVSVATYQVTADGIYDTDPTGGALSSAASALIGTALEYPRLMPAAGQSRRASWAGSLGEDWDGDGRNDGFSFVYEQVLVGFEDVVLPSQFTTAIPDVAHIRNRLTISYIPTRAGVPGVTLIATEDAYFAPNWGLIKSVQSAVDGAGIAVGAVQTLELANESVVGGRLWGRYPAHAPRSIVEVAIDHRDVVYDHIRNKYYASVVSDDPAKANRIVTIDPDSGGVSYSAPVGQKPNLLAIAADGKSLYVGLAGESALLRLSLPAMTTLARTPIAYEPDATRFGWGSLDDQVTRVRSMAASPLDPDIVAIAVDFGMSSTYQPFTEPGVVLFRNMVMQPERPASAFSKLTHDDLLVFDARGNLYGMSSSLRGPPGLSGRYAVTANGLADVTGERQGDYDGFFSIAVADELIFEGKNIFDANSLLPVGGIPGAKACWQGFPAADIFCLTHGPTALSGVTPSSNTSVAMLAMLTKNSRNLSDAVPIEWGSYVPRKVVPGPPHQVAISHLNETGSGNVVRLYTDSRWQ